MRVIKYPESLKNWKSTCTCERCWAELEFGVKDVWGSRSFVGGYTWQYGVTCSECGWNSYVDPVKHKMSARVIAAVQAGPFLTK